MLAKAIVAATALISCAAVPQVSSFVPVPADPHYIRQVQYPLVHKVQCKEGSGTAFRVGANHWLSVEHVARLTDCKIDDEPITVTEHDGKRDFASLDTADSKPNGFKINCGGFIPGHWYFAIGHAAGLPFHTVIAVYATIAFYPDGKRVLIGPHDFIPGMSGGPVLDEAGQAVGLVNAFVPGTPISLSRELKSTSVCGANIA